MPGYIVVPQYLVDALGPRLSSNDDTGRAIAEQLARSESGGTLLQKISAGEELTAVEKAQLPPLLRGHSWDDVQQEVAAAVARL